MDKMLVRILDVNVDVEPEEFIASAPASTRDIYSAMVFALKSTKHWSAVNVKRVFGAVVVISNGFGGASLYLPFFNHIRSRENFILSIVEHVCSDAGVSPGELIELLKEADPGKSAAADAAWANSFSDLLSAVHRYLLDQDPPCSGSEVRALLKLIIESLIDACSGRVFYIPSGGSLVRVMRDRAIWNDFNGSNVRELSKRYGLSVPRVYEILKNCRTESRAKV